MRCELSFDAGAAPGDRPGGGRLVEIVDDEMRRVAISGEREVVVLTEPGMYGAIIKLEDERTLTKAFEVREGDTHLAIRFQERPRGPEGTAGDPAPPKRRRRFLLVAILMLVPVIGLTFALLLPRMEMTTISSEAPPEPAGARPEGARTDPGAARRPGIARDVARDARASPDEVETARARALEAMEAARARALEEMALARASEEAGSRMSANSASRDAIGRLERPAPLDPPLGPPPSSPTPGAEVPGREAALPEAPEDVAETVSWHSLSWLPILLAAAASIVAAATALIGFRSLGGGLAAGRRGVEIPAGGSVVPDPGWLDRLVPRRSSARPRQVRVAVACVSGFQLGLHLSDAKLRRVGDSFSFVRKGGSTRLPRVEIALPGQARGLAVMLPLAENDDAEIEIREASGSHPHAHIVFGDADVQQMLRYRDNYCLEESAEIAASVIARLSEAPINQPAGLATSLYFMLRTGRLPLDAIAEPAARLAREHAWLPDAHAILGEIAARQARHEDALISFLKVGPLGPPFATAGMTYLSDRLSLYDAHLETGLKLSGMRQPLDSLLRDAREVTRRMIAGRVITTFAIGEPTKPLAIPS